MNRLKLRALPIQHKQISLMYKRILRGIHYRHEFARRNPEVAKASTGLICHLGLTPESVPAFEGSDGSILTDLLAKAYRQTMKTSKGIKAKKLLRDFFVSYGVLPVAPAGNPFLGERLRLDKKSGESLHKLTDKDHIWLKETWNDLILFEIFAMAEFSLPRPIMMPAIILPVATTRTDRIKTSGLIVPSNISLSMYINPNQADAVLDDYIKAMIEQVREGHLNNRGEFCYSNKRFDPFYFERYLDVLDVKAACGNMVRLSNKIEFYKRCKDNAHVQSAECEEFFKESLGAARKYRDDWLLIL